MAAQERDPLEAVDNNRRVFIKRMAAAAFTVPVVTTFGMSALASAGPRDGRPPVQTLPNQAFPNQAPPPGRPRRP